MIKKLIMVPVVIFIFLQCAFADESSQMSETNSDAEMAKTYQEGLKAAAEGKKNQALWAQGMGNPEAAKMYQEGLSAAEKGKRDQQRWANEQQIS